MSTERESRIELKVGVLIVVCLGLLIGFLVLLGGWRRGETTTLVVDFDSSGGLKVGAPVKIAGIDAGRVEDVTFGGGKVDPDAGRPVWVRVTLSVNPEMRATLRDDASFFITTAGLLGEKYVEIDPGRATSALGETVSVGTPPPRIEILAAQVGKALDQVNHLLGDNRELIAATIRDAHDTVVVAKAAMEDGRAFLQAAQRTLGTVDTKGTHLIDVATKALEEYTPGTGETGNGIRAAVRSGAGVLERVESVVGDGSELRGILTDAQGAVSDARGVIRAVNGEVTVVSGKLQGVLGTADSALVDGKREVLVALGKVQTIMDDARDVVGQIRRGEGTVGALLMDREIFDDARELMKDIKRHPWKVLWKE